MPKRVSAIREEARVRSSTPSPEPKKLVEEKIEKPEPLRETIPASCARTGNRSLESVMNGGQETTPGRLVIKKRVRDANLRMMRLVVK